MIVGLLPVGKLSLQILYLADDFRLVAQDAMLIVLQLVYGRQLDSLLFFLPEFSLCPLLSPHSDQSLTIFVGPNKSYVFCFIICGLFESLLISFTHGVAGSTWDFSVGVKYSDHVTTLISSFSLCMCTLSEME